MRVASNFFKNLLLFAAMLSIQSCEREVPTAFSGDVVDTVTGNNIPGVTLLVSYYNRAPLLTLAGIIRMDTIQTDGQGHFNLVVPYTERLSRFSINVLRKVGNQTFEFVNTETDCSPYDCDSFLAGYAYKFELKIYRNSL